MRSPYTTFHRVQSTAHQPNSLVVQCCSHRDVLMLFCPSFRRSVRFLHDDHTVTCWSHVDVVVVTIHILHVLATPVLVTHHCELSCRETRDVSPFVPRRIFAAWGETIFCTNAPASSTQGFCPDRAFSDYLENQKKRKKKRERTDAPSGDEGSPASPPRRSALENKQKWIHSLKIMRKRTKSDYQCQKCGK